MYLIEETFDTTVNSKCFEIRTSASSPSLVGATVVRFSKPLPGNSSLTYFGKKAYHLLSISIQYGRLKYISLIFALSKECIFDREADRQFQTNRNGQLRGGSTSSPHPDVLTK